MTADASEFLRGLGLGLDPNLGVRGRYSPARRVGDTLWVSGVTARGADGPGPLGVVGATSTVEQAREAARRAAANLLSAIESTVGLGAVVALGHLRGYVRAVPEFGEHPHIVDAASEVLVGVLGDAVGQHARTALGVASLPGGAVVELDLVCRVRTS